MKRRKTTSPVFQGRRLFLMLGLLFIIGILMLRAVWLEVFQQSMLQERADARQTSIVTVPAYRGMITDRNGEPMAVSSPVESLWCNPSRLLETRAQLRDQYDLASNVEGKSSASEVETLAGHRYLQLEDGLAKIEEALEMEPGALIDKLEEAKDKKFMYLGRQLPPELAEKILALELPGVSSTREYRRFYPLAETAGHVIGMTNIDGQGIEGIEKARDDLLAGRNGRKRVVRDGRRRIVEDIESIEDMVPGKDLQLSIDKRIQYLGYKALKTQVYKLKAKAGSLVVMDAHNGEILAMANIPSFNPNNRKELEPYRIRNRAVTDEFEPGSTLKPFTVAAALEARVIKRLLRTGPRVLSTGGGAFMNDATRAIVLANGLSVWLKADLDVLWARVSKRDTRPLLKTANPRQTLSDLLDQRYPVYANADITVQSRDAEKEIIAAETVAAIARLDDGQEKAPAS